MKKTAAIFFLIILLFNTGAYTFFIHWLQKKSSVRLASAIDKNNYDESQLVEISLQLNMPYQQRYTEFERHYGEIEINGIPYTYVKRKIQGDLLILKCIPNKAKEELKAMDDGMAQSNSGTAGEKSPAKNALPASMKNPGFECDLFIHAGPLFSRSTGLKQFNGSIEARLSDGFNMIIQPPPDHAFFI